MKPFKLKTAHYLKKIQNGQLTCQQVANILQTTEDVIESSYNKYIKEQQTFLQKKFEYRSSVIQIVVSIISTVLVLFTLFEMRAERNDAYRPDISLSNTELAISWDKNGLPSISKEAEDTLSKVIHADTAINAIPQIKVYNLGVGTAKNITLEWYNQKNMKNFINIFNSYDGINVFIDDNSVYIETDSIKHRIWTPINSKIDFLLNSKQDFDTLPFPSPYYQLIKEMCIRTRTQDVPPLYLQISYSDVQGKIYNKTIQIHTSISFLVQDVDGSGFCVLNLNSVKEDVSMVSFELLNLNSDTLTAITPLLAIFVSIVSIVITVIFSVFQHKHNKNSVKPISSIRVSDYEDLLSVKIENVGTGPLIIDELLCKNDHCESSNLISMMPSIEQSWTTFLADVNGWTIPVSGKITLISISPKTDNTRTLVRKELSKITVYIEYRDIYNTKFHDERTLNFFGRHFE